MPGTSDPRRSLLEPGSTVCGRDVTLDVVHLNIKVVKCGGSRVSPPLIWHPDPDAPSAKSCPFIPCPLTKSKQTRKKIGRTWPHADNQWGVEMAVQIGGGKVMMLQNLVWHRRVLDSETQGGRKNIEPFKLQLFLAPSPGATFWPCGPTAIPPLLRHGVSLCPIALCFSGIERYRTISPPSLGFTKPC